MLNIPTSGMRWPRRCPVNCGMPMGRHSVWNNSQNIGPNKRAIQLYRLKWKIYGKLILVNTYRWIESHQIKFLFPNNDSVWTMAAAAIQQNWLEETFGIGLNHKHWTMEMAAALVGPKRKKKIRIQVGMCQFGGVKMERSKRWNGFAWIAIWRPQHRRMFWCWTVAPKDSIECNMGRKSWNEFDNCCSGTIWLVQLFYYNWILNL